MVPGITPREVRLVQDTAGIHFNAFPGRGILYAALGDGIVDGLLDLSLRLAEKALPIWHAFPGRIQASVNNY
jgi:hypothetical protein